MHTKSKHIVGGVIFFLGIFTGLALALTAVWGKYEAVSYFFEGTTYASFNGLRCPVLMTRSEIGLVRAIFDNPSGQDYEPYYQMEIGGTVPRNFEDHLLLKPHASESVQWAVGANDINLEYFILAKLDTLPDAVYPAREATCGTLVLNISNFTGGQLFWFMLIFSLITIPGGFALWTTTNSLLIGKALELQRAVLTLAILVPLSLFAGLMGWWFMGIILCAVTFLLLAIMLSLAIS